MLEYDVIITKKLFICNIRRLEYKFTTNANFSSHILMKTRTLEISSKFMIFQWNTIIINNIADSLICDKLEENFSDWIDECIKIVVIKDWSK